MTCFYVIIFGLITWNNYVFVFGYNDTFASILTKTILADYVHTVRPSYASSTKPVIVNVVFILYYIKEYDPVSSKLSITGSFSFQWIDERIQWNPASNGDVYSLIFHQKDVWVPNLWSMNDFNDIKHIGSSETPVQYTHDGKARWFPSNVFDFICNADITYFPFDTQNCSVAFLSFSHTTNELQMLITNQIDLTYYLHQPIWDLKSAKIQLTAVDYTNVITMTFIIKRKSSFFVVNIILPIITLCIMNLLVFFLPAEAGERVGFSVTVLLSIAVYLTIVSDTLPAVSNPSVAIICYILFFHLIISVLIMACTILGLRFYFRNDAKVGESVPKWIAIIAKKLGQCACRKKKVDVLSLDNKYCNDMKEEHLDNKDNEFKTEESLQKLNNVSWRDAALAFDMICFTFFAILIGMLDLTFSCIILSTS